MATEGELTTETVLCTTCGGRCVKPNSGEPCAVCNGTGAEERRVWKPKR